MKVELRNNELPDPKTFIKPLPIPLPSHKGVKIQARSFHVYNATLPLREDVRKENYARRRDQMTTMGFKTPMNIPYKVIGDPLYLDHKRIVLYGLGQLTELDKESDRTEFINIPTSLNKSQETKNKPTEQSFSFRNLKKSKELINLQDEVNKTKNYIRRVKLGYSYFDMLKEEEEKRHKKKVQAENVITMQLRSMQDSEEDFEPESDEENNENYYETNNRDGDSPDAYSVYNRGNMMTPFNSENNPSTNRDRMQKNRAMTNEDNKEKFSYNDTAILNSNRPQTYPINHMNQSVNGSRPYTICDFESVSNLSHHKHFKATGIKKQKDVAKPYTPMYSSLLSKDESFLMDKTSISRQLSILLWLLESINVEAPNAIGPLGTCFSIKDLGGEKINEKVLNNLAEIDKAWKKFEKKKSKLKE